MTLDEYQAEAIKTAIYPESARVIYPALGLAGEAGEVANKVKKIIRDHGGIVSDTAREELKGELCDSLWYIADLAHDLDLSLSEIAEANLTKLRDRQARGVLGGSGDNR